MTTEELIILLFCAVDDEMSAVPKHPQAHLSPSELVISWGTPSAWTTMELDHRNQAKRSRAVETELCPTRSGRLAPVTWELALRRSRCQHSEPFCGENGSR